MLPTVDFEVVPGRASRSVGEGCASFPCGLTQPRDSAIGGRCLIGEGGRSSIGSVDQILVTL